MYFFLSFHAMMQIKLETFILMATSFKEFAFFFCYELYQIVKPEVPSLCSWVQATQMSK